jgi:hypothetical protein
MTREPGQNSAMTRADTSRNFFRPRSFRPGGHEPRLPSVNGASLSEPSGSGSSRMAPPEESARRDRTRSEQILSIALVLPTLSDLLRIVDVLERQGPLKAKHACYPQGQRPPPVRYAGTAVLVGSNPIQ